MKFLNASATKVFNKLIADLNAPGDACKIETSEGTFMAVSVDFLMEQGGTKFYAVAHRYEKNGDLVPDPDVQFAVINGYVVPFAIDQYCGYQESARFSGGKLTHLNARGQADLVQFCNMWMRNINQQQTLKAGKKAA